MKYLFTKPPDTLSSHQTRGITNKGDEGEQHQNKSALRACVCKRACPCLPVRAGVYFVIQRVHNGVDVSE